MYEKVAELEFTDSTDAELELVVYSETDFDGEIARLTLTDDDTHECVNFYLTPAQAKKVRKALKPGAKQAEKPKVGPRCPLRQQVSVPGNYGREIELSLWGEDDDEGDVGDLSIRLEGSRVAHTYLSRDAARQLRDALIAGLGD